MGAGMGLFLILVWKSTRRDYESPSLLSPLISVERQRNALSLNKNQRNDQWKHFNSAFWCRKSFR